MRLVLLSMLVIVGCSEATSNSHDVAQAYNAWNRPYRALECVVMWDDGKVRVSRCANDEITCYMTLTASGLVKRCRFKDERL